MKTGQVRRIVAGISLLLFVGSAQAVVFTASGTATDGRPMNGEAEFTFDAGFTTLFVELSNTAGTGQLGGISSVLDGIKFTLDGAPLSALTLDTSFAAASFDPSGTVNCSTGTCVYSATAVSVTTSGWGYQGTGSAAGLLAAGNGSFKPYGIVNTNITTTDGIPNAVHNPYLVGPVTFKFDIAGSYSDLSVSSADFYFGTQPDIVTAVPEPETYAMLVAGLGLLGLALRRRNKKLNS